MEQKKKYPGIRGVVADLIQAEKKYETAIETALAAVSRILSRTMRPRQKALIEYLKKGRFGRATFLPLTSMQRKQASVPDGVLRETGVLGVASDLGSALTRNTRGWQCSFSAAHWLWIILTMRLPWAESTAKSSDGTLEENF